MISAELQESATLQAINQSTLQTNKRTQIGSPWEYTHNLSYKCFMISLTILVLVKWIPKRFQYSFFTNLAMTQTKFDLIELYMGINYSIKLFCILFNWIITEILDKYAKELIIYRQFLFVVTLTEVAIIFLNGTLISALDNYVSFNCRIFPSSVSLEYLNPWKSAVIWFHHRFLRNVPFSLRHFYVFSRNEKMLEYRQFLKWKMKQSRPILYQ